jgi:hypothetical protein
MTCQVTHTLYQQNDLNIIKDEVFICGRLSDFSFYIDSQISVHRKFKSLFSVFFGYSEIYFCRSFILFTSLVLIRGVTSTRIAQLYSGFGPCSIVDWNKGTIQCFLFSPFKLTL